MVRDSSFVRAAVWVGWFFGGDVFGFGITRQLLRTDDRFISLDPRVRRENPF